MDSSGAVSALRWPGGQHHPPRPAPALGPHLPPASRLCGWATGVHPTERVLLPLSCSPSTTPSGFIPVLRGFRETVTQVNGSLPVCALPSLCHTDPRPSSSTTLTIDHSQISNGASLENSFRKKIQNVSLVSYNLCISFKNRLGLGEIDSDCLLLLIFLNTPLLSGEFK